MAEPYELSAAELGDLYRRRSLSPVEATRSVLARIERWEPHLRATYALDPEGALEAARASEARWLRGGFHIDPGLRRADRSNRRPDSHLWPLATGRGRGWTSGCWT
jgi:hypothetical protein